ncbi:MAG: methyltransferase domain-containing protein [Gemmatimonadota bacterium]|nr:methyltransferase domain-containing protein [Gemmatimonadota bacterium]
MRLAPPPRLGPEIVEWMDAGVGSEAEDVEAYRLLDRVNRLQSGHRATLGALETWLSATDRPSRAISFVDVAGGDGRFADRVVDWGARRGVTIRPIVIDTNPAALAAASIPGRSADPVRARALALPLADGATDVVHASCFFHHLSVDDAREGLAEMCRASRSLVIVNDLVRSRFAAVAIRAITRLLVDNRLVRHDGPISVLKAFTPDELLSIAHAATPTAPDGWRWRIGTAFPYRMALVGARIGTGRRG